MTSQDKTNTYVETIKDLSFKRGWFTRLRIKRIIRKELSSEDYNKYGIKLTETILDIGESVTDDEVTTLMEAANV
jgi:predicted metal-binding transcription factor (methanogenesis marker protein 9)